MRKMTLAAAVLALAIFCASANAAVYCVPTSFACGGTGKATLAEALNATNANPDPDTIMLGPESFTVSPGVVGQAGRPVHIVGSGMRATVLEASYAGVGDFYGLSLYGADDLVSDLTVHEASSGHGTALYLDGAAAQRVRIDQRDNTLNSYATAVQLHDGASFSDGEALSVLGSAGGLPEGILVDAGLGQTSHVTNTVVQGWDALYTSGAGSVVITSCRVVGQGHAVYAYNDTSTIVEDSTLTGGPLTASSQGGSNVSLLIRHDTLDSARVEARGDSAGDAAHAIVSNTALVGGGSEFTQFVVNTSGTGPARIDVDYSFYAGPDRVDQTQYPGPSNVFNDGGHNAFGDNAQLLDMAGGDLRPRWDSPLVDTGNPVLDDGEPTADLAGGARTVNGRTDIGAYEYGRHTPTISASATPLSVLTGEPVTFTAGAADADPHEPATVTWTFDDGATATGVLATHAFATPGTHTATATTTDPVGLTATAFASVNVSAPLLPRKAMAPAFGFKSLKARKGVVRVVLRCQVIATDCAGTVDLRFGRKLFGRARYAIAHGTKKTIKLKLSTAARKRLSKARHGLRVKVLVKPDGAAAKSKTVRLTGR
jgi:PKD repeat protein